MVPIYLYKSAMFYSQTASYDNDAFSATKSIQPGSYHPRMIIAARAGVANACPRAECARHEAILKCPPFKYVNSKYLNNKYF